MNVPAASVAPLAIDGAIAAVTVNDAPCASKELTAMDPPTLAQVFWFEGSRPPSE